ncbi:MAG: autotransporter outer membrane beta-barrel domain-containing protein [Porphyrobacter sp.]|nr:autotransporter outer membrane beta-barrel domain-containing protein [Porphyrobacter sp.]
MAQAQENFGVRNDDTTLLQITIAQGQTVAGNATGVFAANGPVTVNNAGTIRGDGNAALADGVSMFRYQDQQLAEGYVAAVTNETGGTITGLTDDSRHQRNALMGMPAAQEKGLFVWASGFGGWGDFDATAANFGMETNHNGFVTGVGFGGEGFGIALSGSLGGSEFGLAGRAHRSNVSSTYLALHGTFGKEGGVRGAAGVSYAWHELATSRLIAALLAQSLASRSDAKTLQVFGELNATFLSLGTKVRFGAADARFKPYASLAWNHAMGDRGVVNTARFAAGGGTFAVAGLSIPKSSAEAEAGLEYRAGRPSIGAGYAGVIASNRNAHGGCVTLCLSF